MTDSKLNDFVASGTNAQRLAFTPSPPTPSSGPAAGYFWFETDTGDSYSWKAGTGWQKVNNAAGGAMSLISEVTTSASQASVSFTSIAATFRDLLVVVRGRGTNASTFVNVLLRFNNDSGANYDRLDYEVDTTPQVGEALAQTSLTIGFMAAASAPANVADAFEAKVFDYRGTTFQKAISAKSTAKLNTTTGNVLAVITSGWWRSTAAINRVDVLLSAGAFVDNSIVSLYGVN